MEIRPGRRAMIHAGVNALRELQVKSDGKLSALMPSILDKAFKGGL
jgi:hypothetical protein